MATTTESSTSAVDSVEKLEVMKKAADLLAQGKRNMLCGEVPKAVNLFEEAVQLLVKECGELSRDCADAYFSCGSALLELGRMETNVLGTALEGVEVEEEKEEEESEQFEKPPAEDADKDEEETEETVDEEEAVEGDESADGEKDEDVPNFQLAWEYLDLAKVIYLKNESKEDQLKAAECHLKLGEVSMETEQHTIAVEDLLSALKIQQKYLAPDDRLIAETHYQLGLAYGLGKEFKLSIEQYQLAISVIEAKIASLKKVLEDEQIDAENKENLETNPELKKFADEIKELQDLIPEMKNKTEDARIEENDLQKMKAIVKENLFPSGTTKEFGSPSKKSGGSVTSGDVDENGERKASDIAHLVRKKRKPEEDTSAPSEQEVKKIRQEVVSDDVNVETKVDEAKMNVDEQVNTEESKVNSDNSNINVEPKVNGDEPNVNGDEPKVNGDEPGVNGDDIKVSGDIIESKVISKVEVSPTEDAKMNGDTETPSIETSASTEVAPMAT
ncbi:nuclear autoantigenic sperm protein-like isoform X2 [Biomphalaria glabrata]|uniref:Nuclear autoantigenic sperm protein-like isoform X2 n=1 Tax=Biomphalaria glabrata TaxID=6526 RepID=A0A9W3ADD2_BIOGL|nr:nuclear autoantigenic sperm protein-like isoform X2 [Biomphalaria glabrata]